MTIIKSLIRLSLKNKDYFNTYFQIYIMLLFYTDKSRYRAQALTRALPPLR